MWFVLRLGYAQPRLRLLIRSWFCCVLFVFFVFHDWCFDVVLFCKFACGFVSLVLFVHVFCFCFSVFVLVLRSFLVCLFYCDGVCVVVFVPFLVLFQCW